MKLLRSFLVVLAFGASISSAQARDSFSFGINIGGYSPYGHGHPAVGYHVAPQVIYYSAPSVYHHAPRALHVPIIGHRGVYYGGSHHYYAAPRHHAPRNHGYYGGHRNHGHRGHHR